MILLFHISVALLSVFYTAYLFFHPSKEKLNVSYALLALTIISGTYLIATKPATMTQTCTTGLVYVGVMLVGIKAVKYKLAAQINKL